MASSSSLTGRFLAVLTLACLSQPALAVDAKVVTQEARARTLQDELDDLFSESRPDRRYAGRNLLRRTTDAVRVASRAKQPEREADALLFLEDMDNQVAPRCLKGLEEAEVVVPCARILGMLETQAALSPLEDVLESARSKRTRRFVAQAIHRIEQARVEPGESRVAEPSP